MNVKTLIIEDDQEITESISLAFKFYWPEAEVIYTNLGERGIEMVRTETPHAVILDLGLPDISGFEVLQQIRSISSAPIIVLTVRSEEDEFTMALEDQTNDCIVKPFRHQRLLESVQTQVNRWIASQTGSDLSSPYLWRGPAREISAAPRL